MTIEPLFKIKGEAGNPGPSCVHSHSNNTVQKPEPNLRVPDTSPRTFALAGVHEGREGIDALASKP